MSSNTAIKFTSLLIIGVFSFITSCSSVPSVPARFYNLSNGEVINVKLYHFPRDKGEAMAELPHGKTANGNYILASKITQPMDVEFAHGDSNERMISMPDQSDWAEMYGYTSTIEPEPVGSGMFVSDDGMSMRMLLYSVDSEKAYGTGIARDNKGNWYRVHVGKLPED